MVPVIYEHLYKFAGVTAIRSDLETLKCRDFWYKRLTYLTARRKNNITTGNIFSLDFLIALVRHRSQLKQKEKLVNK